MIFLKRYSIVLSVLVLAGLLAINTLAGVSAWAMALLFKELMVDRDASCFHFPDKEDINGVGVHIGVLIVLFMLFYQALGWGVEIKDATVAAIATVMLVSIMKNGICEQIAAASTLEGRILFPVSKTSYQSMFGVQRAITLGIIYLIAGMK